MVIALSALLMLEAITDRRIKTKLSECIDRLAYRSLRGNTEVDNAGSIRISADTFQSNRGNPSTDAS